MEMVTTIRNDTVKVEFKRVLSDCQHNENLVKLGRTHGLLYDYNVIINGELRGCFHARGYKRGYDLLDAEGVLVRAPWFNAKGVRRVDAEYNWRHVGADTKEDFIVEIESEFDYIPTAAQLAERAAKAKAEAEAKEKAEAEARRIRQIKEAGPDLLNALKPFANLLSDHHERLPDDQPFYGIGDKIVTIGELRSAVAAIDKAELP